MLAGGVNVRPGCSRPTRNDVEHGSCSPLQKTAPDPFCRKAVLTALCQGSIAPPSSASGASPVRTPGIPRMIRWACAKSRAYQLFAENGRMWMPIGILTPFGVFVIASGRVQDQRHMVGAHAHDAQPEDHVSDSALVVSNIEQVGGL